MRLTDIKEYLNTLLASFSSVLNLELTILADGSVGESRGYGFMVH